MSVICVTHTSVFLIVSTVVTGLPSRTMGEWNCPENCDDETSHPGCVNRTHGICYRLNHILEKQKDMEILVETLKQDTENSAHSLLVMGTALFVLVPILFLGLALVILKLYLPSFFKCFKKRSNPERRSSSSQCQYLGRIPSSTPNLKQLTISTIKLANQQINESPCPARNRIPRNVPHSTTITETNRQQISPPKKLVRQPSESTCPTESSDTSQGCDNLGLSNSTLHNQSTSSTNRSLDDGNTSTRTLDTTLSPDSSTNQSLSTRI